MLVRRLGQSHARRGDDWPALGHPLRTLGVCRDHERRSWVAEVGGVERAGNVQRRAQFGGAVGQICFGSGFSVLPH